MYAALFVCCAPLELNWHVQRPNVTNGRQPVAQFLCWFCSLLAFILQMHHSNRAGSQQLCAGCHSCAAFLIRLLLGLKSKLWRRCSLLQPGLVFCCLESKLCSPPANVWSPQSDLYNQLGQFLNIVQGFPSNRVGLPSSPACSQGMPGRTCHPKSILSVLFMWKSRMVGKPKNKGHIQSCREAGGRLIESVWGG